MNMDGSGMFFIQERKKLHSFVNTINFLYKFTGPSALTVKKVRSVEGLSVDWVSKNLYFTDFFQGTLSVLRLQSPNETLVLMSGTGKPRSVVVHPLKG